jgi:hypothetical protein
MLTSPGSRYSGAGRLTGKPASVRERSGQVELHYSCKLTEPVLSLLFLSGLAPPRRPAEAIWKTPRELSRAPATRERAQTCHLGRFAS